MGSKSGRVNLIISAQKYYNISDFNNLNMAADLPKDARVRRSGGRAFFQRVFWMSTFAAY
jgi:hypothetical protein